MSSTVSPFTDAIALVPELGVLRCSGDDARTFLHGQLSNDLALQKPDQARLAAYLSAKGRMLASFIVLREGPQDLLLLCHRSVLPAVQKRLTMFVLRAKVRLSDASDQWQLRGLLGAAATRIAGQPLAPWQVAAATGIATAAAGDATAQAIGLYPADGQPRALLLVPDGQTAPAPTAGEAVWASSEVRSGVATLSAAVVEQFVPQMLNYESIGGVSFKKGCYPGQEVVARSQFRGAIKRRAYLAHGQADTLPAPGAEIFANGDPEQECGIVVQSAAAPDGPNAPAGTFDAIVCLRTDDAQAPLHLQSGSTPVALQIRPMPYPLLLDL